MQEVRFRTKTLSIAEFKKYCNDCFQRWKKQRSSLRQPVSVPAFTKPFTAGALTQSDAFCNVRRERAWPMQILKLGATRAPKSQPIDDPS
jgi:hypothetical protein